MQKILNKRVWRDLKENFFRYLALSLLIILSMYLIVSLVGAAETILRETEVHGEKNAVEHGSFSVFVPLTEREKEKLTELGIVLEEMFSLDFTVEDESTVRVFENRKQINQVELDSGRMAKTENEIVLEKRYCAEKKIDVGSEITLGDFQYKVVGIGTVPDYDAPYKKLSDSSVDSKNFGLAFVTDASYEKLLASGKSAMSEEYEYAYRRTGSVSNEEVKDTVKNFEIAAEEIEDPYFQDYWENIVGEKEKFEDATDELIQEYFDVKLSNLVSFMTADENPRIEAAANDQVINKVAGIIAGVIIMILFTYVISVFVVHGIEKESSVIGALYALGVKRQDLMFHYLMLPVVVTFLAGVIGTMLGFSKAGIDYQMLDCYNYFSIPKMQVQHPLYLILYGVVMPPLAAAIVNCIVIRKKLSQPALALIRNEKKSNGMNNINLGNMGFINRFRIRQMLKEARTGFTVLFGMFISLLIMMLGIDCYVMCQHLSLENKADTKYDYMYTYKYPDESVPRGGEACYAKTLKKEIYGYNLDVTVLGIDQSNPYFDVDVSEGKNTIVASSAMAQKYQLNVGDDIVLSDEEEEMDYAFHVEEITQFSTGLYVFMDIDSMRELFRQTDSYYNVVLADHDLEIDAGKLYAVTTKAQVEKSSGIFIDMMWPMIYMMTTVSALIFCIVMYLMMKVMIERASFSISLIKIFGYRTGEIKKLYLNGNFYLVAVGAAICIPLSKWAMDSMYPVMVSNIGTGMNLTFSWQLYLGIYIGIILLYLIINQILVGKLKKLLPANVLKNRE